MPVRLARISLLPTCIVCGLGDRCGLFVSSKTSHPMSLAEAAAPSVALVQTSYVQFFAEPLRFFNEHIIADIHIRISGPLLIEPQIQSVLKLRILSRLYGPYLVQRRGIIRNRQPELFSTHNVTNCVLGDNISEVIKKLKM